MSKALIFDGNNLAHRCKHTYQLSYKGKDVSILYGVLRVMSSVMRKHDPVVVVVAWDDGIPKFRMERMPSYKAHRRERDPVDEEYYQKAFRPQLDELQYILPQMGIVSVRKRYTEADDIMAQAALIFNYETVKERMIITTDQDLYQMVRHGITVWSPVKDIIVDRPFVEEMIGCDPIWWGTYRAMVGDPSDGIPGIEGIGPKGAKKVMAASGGMAGAVLRMAEDYDLPISDKLCDRIVEAGFGHFNAVNAVSGLWQDHCGVVRIIRREIDRWEPYYRKGIAKFLRDWNFTSLQDPGFYGPLKALEDPRPLVENRSGIVTRTPVIAPPREPLD